MEDPVVSDLQETITELKGFLEASKKERVKSLLNKEISQLEKELNIIKSSKPVPLSPPKNESSTTQTEYLSITNFAWDQNSSSVSIYITSGIDGIEKIPIGNIKCDFKEKSFDLTIMGLNDKNYRLRVYPLNKNINEKESSFKVKTNSISIKLKKSGTETWDDLKEKKGLFSKKPELGKNEDPSASLMNMMKEMYESGDDNMKRMIAESWTKAQTEKGKKPI